MRTVEHLGAVWYETPITGLWLCWPHLPERVSMLALGGAFFERTRWFAPRHGAVASYREVRCERSRHLYVLADGTWIIDHIDDYRPNLWNCGLPSIVKHDVADNDGKAVKFIVGAAVLAALAAGIRAVAKAPKRR